MSLERDTAGSLSIDSLSRKEIPNLVVGMNDRPRVLFAPGGDQSKQGSAGAFFSALWLCNDQVALQIYVGPGGILNQPTSAPFKPGPGRWPIETDFSVPSMRVGATASLVARTPTKYVEFSAITPSFILYNATGAFRYDQQVGGTIATPVSISLATMAASLRDPAFNRFNGRTIIGSERQVIRNPAIRAASYSSAIEVWVDDSWGRIKFQASDGSFWWLQPSVGTGILTAVAVT